MCTYPPMDLYQVGYVLTCVNYVQINRDWREELESDIVSTFAKPPMFQHLPATISPKVTTQAATQPLNPSSPWVSHSCADKAWLVELIPVSNLTARMGGPWRTMAACVKGGAAIILKHWNMVKIYDKDRKHRIWEDPIFIFAGKANKGAPILQITSGRSGAMSSTDKQGNQTEPTQKNVQNTYNIIQPPIYAFQKKAGCMHPTELIFGTFREQNWKVWSMCVSPRNSHPMANRALKDLLLVLAVAMTKCVWVKILAMADLFGSIYLDGDGAIISLLRLLYD